MKGKIAVEGSLKNITQELQEDGYEVVRLNETNMGNVDAVVITGEDNNTMNMSDIKTKAPVINARGLTADQVSLEVKKRIKKYI